MRKTFNKGGDAAFAINTKHIVTLETFADALAKYCWDEGITFDVKIKKKEATTILIAVFTAIWRTTLVPNMKKVGTYLLFKNTEIRPCFI